MACVIFFWGSLYVLQLRLIYYLSLVFYILIWNNEPSTEIYSYYHNVFVELLHGSANLQTTYFSDNFRKKSRS